MQKVSVIGFIEHTGQIVCVHTEAESLEQAFLIAANDCTAATFVAAVPGHIRESDNTVAYPGDGVVDADSIIELAKELADG